MQVKVKITELDNGQVAWSNIINTSTDCSGNQAYTCEEGGMVAGGGEEESMTASFDESGVAGAVDYPLSLRTAGANPSRSLEGVVYGIPNSMAGRQYDLALFDLSGRRVVSFGNGAAKAGRWLELTSGKAQTRLAAGVYFLKLTIGDRNLTRTVIIVP